MSSYCTMAQKQKQLTFNRMISISEYFIPFTKIGISLYEGGEKIVPCVNKSYPSSSSQNTHSIKSRPRHHTHCTRWPESISLQMGCSARVNQNSQASSATFSSGSCVLCSMYCRRWGGGECFRLTMHEKLSPIKMH